MKLAQAMRNTKKTISRSSAGLGMQFRGTAAPAYQVPDECKVLILSLIHI